MTDPNFLTSFKTLCYGPETMRVEWVSLWLVGVAVHALLAGCATRGSVRKVESELARVSSQVRELRRLHESSVNELARTVGELKELQSSTARLALTDQATAQQLSRVEARLTDVEGAIRAVRVSMADLSRELSQLAARPPVQEPAARGRPPRSGSPDQLYAAALASMRAGEHGQAVLDFLDLISKFPKHPLAGHAQYWIGEAYYLQRDFRQALVEFQTVIEAHGKGGKAADALLKVGLCYRALHEPLRAREVWSKLIEEFPKSEAARKARALLRDRSVPTTQSR